MITEDRVIYKGYASVMSGSREQVLLFLHDQRNNPEINHWNIRIIGNAGRTEFLDTDEYVNRFRPLREVSLHD